MSLASAWSPIRFVLKADRRAASRWRFLSIPFLRRQALFAALAIPMLFVITWWYSAFIEIAGTNPQVRLSSVSVELAPGAAIEIGRTELGQGDHPDSAEVRHVRLARLTQAQGGGLQISNIATRHRLYLRYQSGLETFADRIPLLPATQVFAGRMRLVVDSAENDVLVFKLIDTGAAVQSPRTFRAAVGSFGATLADVTSGGQSELPPCGETGMSASTDRVMRASARFLASRIPALSRREAQIATFGGFPYPAGNCISGGVPYFAVAGLPWRGVRIMFVHGVFFVAPGDAVSPQDVPVRVVAPRKPTVGFTDVTWSFDKNPTDTPDRLERVVVGRTSYDVTVRSDGARSVVTFIPRESVARMSAEEEKLVSASAGDANSGWKPSFTARAALLHTPGWLSSGNIGRGEPGAGGSPNERLPTVLNGGERATRLLFIALTIGLVATLCRIPSHVWRILRRRQVDADGNIPLGHRWMPVILTLVCAALSLAPDVATFLGFDLSPQLAIRLMTLNWGIASLAVLWSGGGVLLALVWLAVLVMTSIGSLNLLGMAVDGDTTRWLEFFGKHKLLFLDLVPPFIVAVSTAPLRSMRPVVEELVAGARPGIFYWLVRWIPTIFLIVAFVLWLLVGGQEGILGFQPVEAGKFAACIVCAAVLIGLSADARRATARRSRVRRLVAPVSVIVFLGLLLGVPVKQSDYSPALIIASLVCGLSVIAILPALIGVFQRSYERHKAFWEIPLVFRPPSPRGRRPAFLIAGVSVIIVILSPLWVPKASSLGLWFSLKVWSIPADRQAALTKLECALGQGRFVPIERFIAWKDLGFETAPLPRSQPPAAGTPDKRPPAPSQDACSDDGRDPDAPATQGDETATAAAQGPPTARYRDLEYQIIRSRVLLAHAPCALDQEVVRAMPFADALRGIAAKLNLLTESSKIDLCAPFQADDTTWLGDCGRRNTTGAAATGAGPAPRRSLLACGERLRLPVVQSDFAPTFLMSRFGLASGAIFYAGQALFVICASIGFVRLRQAKATNATDRSVRGFLATLLAGTVALFVLHWSISWCNVLGLLPVMGQPMTLLSAATSHHLFMTLPCLVVIVVAFRFARFTPPPLRIRVPPRL